ncbi:MAG: 50S ribosomal protein L29 [Caldilineaceae bacterium]
MKANEIRSLSNAELGKHLDDSYQELFNLRFQRVAGQVTNSARFKQVRREIARMKTVLRERELEQS